MSRFCYMPYGTLMRRTVPKYGFIRNLTALPDIKSRQVPRAFGITWDLRPAWCDPHEGYAFMRVVPVVRLL